MEAHSNDHCIVKKITLPIFYKMAKPQSSESSIVQCVSNILRKICWSVPESQPSLLYPKRNCETLIVKNMLLKSYLGVVNHFIKNWQSITLMKWQSVRFGYFLIRLASFLHSYNPQISFVHSVPFLYNPGSKRQNILIILIFMIWQAVRLGLVFINLQFCKIYYFIYDCLF